MQFPGIPHTSPISVIVKSVDAVSSFVDSTISELIPLISVSELIAFNSNNFSVSFLSASVHTSLHPSKKELVDESQILISQLIVDSGQNIDALVTHTYTHFQQPPNPPYIRLTIPSLELMCFRIIARF